MKLQILNTRERNRILQMIAEQWEAKMDHDYVFLKSGSGRIYIVNKDVFDLDLSKLRIDSVGLYFGEERAGDLRLSIEGSQIIGPCSKKNVVELDEKEVKEWMKGMDIDRSEGEGFVIIKSGTDFFGCGKSTKDKILNYYPKARRVRTEP